MACRDARSLMSAVLDGRASADERALVAQHLEACAACRAEVRELEAVGVALKSLPAPEAPVGYHESFLSRLTMKIDDQEKDEAKAKAKVSEPRKEDSGLLEIRKMASRDITAQEASRRRDVEEAVAAVSAVDIPAAVSQPMVVATPTAPPPRRGWIAPVAALGGLVVVVGVVFAMMQANTREAAPAPELAAAPPPVPAVVDHAAPAGAAPTAASQPTAAAAGPAVAMAPNEATPPKAAAVEPVEREKKPRAAKGDAPEPPAKGREARAPKEPREPKVAKGKEPPAPAAKPEPAAPPAPKSGKNADDLDELLRAGATVKKEEKKADPAEDLPDALTPEQIKKGMTSVKGRVMACYDKFQVDGIAKMQVVIGKNGKISSVKMTGPFVGTETGACVAAAVRGASFPRFKGKPLTIGYTYLLKR